MNDWAGLQVNELAPHVERKCVAEGRCGGRLAYPAAAAASVSSFGLPAPAAVQTDVACH